MHRQMRASRHALPRVEAVFDGRIHAQQAREVTGAFVDVEARELPAGVAHHVFNVLLECCHAQQQLPRQKDVDLTCKHKYSTCGPGREGGGRKILKHIQ